MAFRLFGAKPLCKLIVDFWLDPYKNTFERNLIQHDDVIKWNRSPVDSPHNGPVNRSLVFSVTYVWTDCWTNNCIVGYLRGHDVHIMSLWDLNILPGYQSERWPESTRKSRESLLPRQRHLSAGWPTKCCGCSRGHANIQQRHRTKRHTEK